MTPNRNHVGLVRAPGVQLLAKYAADACSDQSIMQHARHEAAVPKKGKTVAKALSDPSGRTPGDFEPSPVPAS